MLETDIQNGGHAYRQIDRGRASEQILDHLRRGILDGTFARGAKLPTERQLADGYGVSGPTVREAISGLTAMRLVDVRHGSGVFVTADTEALIAVSLRSMIQLERVGMPDVLGVLGVLNEYAAELAAANASEDDILVLRRALDRVDQAPDAESIIAGLTEFLGGLACASGNPLLASLCNFLAGLQITLAHELSGGSYRTWKRISGGLARERRKLLGAIAARNADAARTAARVYHRRAFAVISTLPNAVLVRASDPTFAYLLGSLIRRNATPH